MPIVEYLIFVCTFLKPKYVYLYALYCMEINERKIRERKRARDEMRDNKGSKKTGHLFMAQPLREGEGVKVKGWGAIFFAAALTYM